MKKYVLLSTLFLIMVCGSVSAQGMKFHWIEGTKVVQQPQPTAEKVLLGQDQSDELKTQAQILSELKVSRAVIAEKDKQITALNGQIDTQKTTIQVISEQRDFYKQASSERKQAGTLDDQNVLLLRQQISDERQEIMSLRNENDKLRNSRDWRTVLGFAGGAVAGYAAAHK
jgi:hypothetical protein